MSHYYFCVDSDGCAMDTMTYKHEKFFGPLAAEIFEVEDPKAFQENWERINLYSRTRGINRFTALVAVLNSVNYQGIDALSHWVDTTLSLSNDSLKETLDKEGAKDLQLALKWSEAVNKGIKETKGLDTAFDEAREGLKKLAQLGNVYVVSSANKEAVKDEWERHGLMESVTDLYCQDRGKKADVIKGFIEGGQDKHKIIMIGDSPGDLEAAQKNSVRFFPILVGKEKISWEILEAKIADKFVANQYTERDEQEFIEAFWSNLD